MRLRSTRLACLAHSGASAPAGPPAAPVNSTAPVISGTGQLGSVLSVSRGGWTGSSPITFSYAWFADDVEIDGATIKTYAVPADEGGLDVVYTAQVSATNAVGSAGPVATSNSKTAVGVPPSFTVAPAITGTMLPGETVSATYTSAGTGTVTPAYTWFANGEEIDDEVGNTLALSAGQIGQTITVQITLTSSWGSVSQTSAARLVIHPAPVNTTAPAITGTPQRGETLTVSNGTWSYSPVSYAYQWVEDAAPITGQTAATYLVPDAPEQIGKVIHAVVTATNATGSTDAAADGVEIVDASGSFMAATGGTVTTDGDYKVHTFTAGDDFVVTSGGTCDALLVGGGGGAGASPGSGYLGGGGGAGGILLLTDYSLSAGIYPIVVGSGGDGGTPGTDGDASSFDGNAAQGGGGGGAGLFGAAETSNSGRNGGSGGGGGGVQSGTTPPGGTGAQGYAGSNGSADDSGAAGGGGGAGGAGAGPGFDAAGGAGYSSSITGSAVTYAAGGKAGNSAGAAPTANTGNGGNAGSSGSTGATGATGVVIVRYKFQ
ncbi:MAG: hypothetical protein KF686_16050 [Ramlibacter sp.]|nr:hypothetical protein [Ramlibacter sp.]